MLWTQTNTILLVAGLQCFFKTLFYPSFALGSILLWCHRLNEKKSLCLAFSLLVKLSPIKLDFRRIGRICHGEQIYFSSAFIRIHFLTEPSSSTTSCMFPILVRPFRVGWLKMVQIPHTNCPFLVAGCDDHSVEVLSISTEKAKTGPNMFDHFESEWLVSTIFKFSQSLNLKSFKFCLFEITSRSRF